MNDYKYILHSKLYNRSTCAERSRSMERFYNLLLFIFAFLLLSISSPAQSPDFSDISPWRLKYYGNAALRNGDIFLALDYFESYCEKKPKDVKALFTLANLYEKSRDYIKAGKLYLDVYKTDSIKFKQALFHHAVMLKMDCRYDEAKFFLQKFYNDKNFMKKDKIFAAKVTNELEGILFAEKQSNKAGKLKVLHPDTSINKAHIELSPVSIDENTFMYASLKSDSVKYYTDEKGYIQIPVREFYKAIKKRGQWIGGYDIPFPFNDKNVNVGNGVFSLDGNRFYYTRCNDNHRGKLICAIFMSKKNKNIWEQPVKLESPVNIFGYTSTQPALGLNSKNNNEILYFISDRKEGKGGLDLWYVEYDIRKDIFKTVKNCGGIINTPGNEMTPYFDYETRSLYFSSNRLPGLGGMDIFRTTGEMKQWSKPENIGAPVNSCADDIYYSISKKREEGFFVSNRKGSVALRNETCCDDIYTYSWTEYINIHVKGEVLAVDSNIIYGLLNDKEMKDTLRGWPPKKLRLKNVLVSVFLVDKETKERFLVKKEKTDGNGEFLFKLEPEKEYLLTFDTTGFFSREIPVSTKDIVKSDTLRLKPVELMDIPKEPIVIKNIYYPFDKAHLTPESQIRIDTTLFFLMTKLPEIIVEISSHTDSKGNDDYNIKLSQKRAESVVNYLIKKGISRERLVAKGYGETNPIAQNENHDGSDNPDGRAKNRRTEFKILGSLKEKYSKVIYDF